MKALTLLLVFFSSHALINYAVATDENQVNISSISAPLLKNHHPKEWVIRAEDTQGMVSRAFLVNPWRWSEAWGNAEAPERLTPGDKIMVGTEDEASFLIYIPTKRPIGQPVTIKLVPEIIATPNANNSKTHPVATLPFEEIAVFTSRGHVFNNHATLKSFPRIVANQDGRLFGFAGSTLYAETHEAIERDAILSVYRQNATYLDPKTKAPLGLGASYVGQVKVIEQRKDLAHLMINKAQQEVRAGDILVPLIPTVEASDFTLHTGTSNSQVIAPVNPIDLSGQYASVVIDGGKRNNFQRGQVFSVYNSPHRCGK